MTIAPDEPLEDAMTLMTANDIGRLPVLDKSGRLIGIVSRNDLVATLYAEQE
jgi:CBS domain-containing protein